MGCGIFVEMQKSMQPVPENQQQALVARLRKGHRSIPGQKLERLATVDDRHRSPAVLYPRGRTGLGFAAPDWPHPQHDVIDDARLMNPLRPPCRREKKFQMPARCIDSEKSAILTGK